VALSLKILSRRFSFLSEELAALVFDPTKFGNREKAYRFLVHSLRRSDPNPTIWRMDAQVHILDVFQDDFNINVA
jgi:hypothetical protein